MGEAVKNFLPNKSRPGRRRQDVTTSVGDDVLHVDYRNACLLVPSHLNSLRTHLCQFHSISQCGDSRVTNL